jgi:hypothetical protein
MLHKLRFLVLLLALGTLVACGDDDGGHDHDDHDHDGEREDAGAGKGGNGAVDGGQSKLSRPGLARPPSGLPDDLRPPR